MKIVVAVSRVPEAPPDAQIDPNTLRLDRAAPVLNPLDVYAIETAKQLKAAHDAHVTVLHVGPAEAESVVRDALAHGLDDAVHVADDAIAGSDALATARVIAAAVQRLGPDLVLFASHTVSARTSLVPPAVAEVLGWPDVTHARALRLDGSSLVAERVQRRVDTVTSPLPAVVSVAEGIYEPTFPSFKGVMAAKSAPYETWSLADLEVAEDTVGAHGSTAVVQSVAGRAPRTRGTVVTDDGSGSSATQLVAFLGQEQG